MLIKQVTGTTTFNEVLSKGISSIIFNSSAALNAAERMVVYKEGRDGNFYFINDMALKDVLSLASYQDESKLKMFAYTGVTYNIELTRDGGYVELLEGEQLRIKFTGLTSGTTYNVSGIESPFPTSQFHVYEEKMFGNTEKVKAYVTKGYDLLGLDQVTDITDVTFSWSNGASTKMTCDEFQAISSSLDDELYNNPPTASNISVIPLGGILDGVSVVAVEITKPVANTVTVLFRCDGDTWKQNH